MLGVVTENVRSEAKIEVSSTQTLEMHLRPAWVHGHIEIGPVTTGTCGIVMALNEERVLGTSAGPDKAELVEDLCRKQLSFLRDPSAWTSREPPEIFAPNDSASFHVQKGPFALNKLALTLTLKPSALPWLDEENEVLTEKLPARNDAQYRLM